MNKFVKAGVSGAAGIALLLGGAGTFALWNDSASVGGGDVNAGTLAIDANGAGVWKNTPHAKSQEPIDDITDFKAVPGDTLEFTQKLDVTAIGDNLNATLSVDGDSLVASSSGDSAANQALLAELVDGMSVEIADAPANIVARGDNTFTVTDAAAVQTATVVVTLPFPRGIEGDNSTQAGQVDLTDLTFELSQN